MLDLTFYSKSKRSKLSNNSNECKRWAIICCTDSDYKRKYFSGYQNRFSEIACATIPAVSKTPTIKVPIFETEVDLNYEVNSRRMGELKELIRKNNSKALLLCNLDFFKRVIHYSTKEEFNFEIAVTANRNLIYFANIGEDRNTLLATFDIFHEEK